MSILGITVTILTLISLRQDYNWQRIVVVDLNPISDDDDTSGLPDVPEMQYYSADWTAPPQSASGSSI